MDKISSAFHECCNFRTESKLNKHENALILVIFVFMLQCIKTNNTK